GPVEVEEARGTARLDYVAGRSRWFARGVGYGQRQPYLIFNPYPGFSSPYHQAAAGIGGGWTWQKSPAVTQELRVGRSGSRQSFDRPHAEVPRLDLNEKLTDGTITYPV